MKAKRINIALVLTSLLGYLEWGRDSSQFLFQAEVDIIRKLFQDPLSVIHPFVILPLFGQLILIITLFQKVPSKRLSFWGVLCLGLLLLFMLIIGLMVMRWRIVISVLPFVAMLFLFIQHSAKIQSSN
jgi:cobalamin biosynthesis protein CobD/CbiB